MPATPNDPLPLRRHPGLFFHRRNHFVPGTSRSQVKLHQQASEPGQVSMGFNESRDDRSPPRLNDPSLIFCNPRADIIIRTHSRNPTLSYRNCGRSNIKARLLDFRSIR